MEILKGKLGVSVSGGADSALVLYLLMKNYKENIVVFNTSNPTYPYHKIAAKNVYEKCKELTGHVNSIYVETPITENYSRFNLFVTPLEWLKRGDVDYVYSGLTANPKNVILKYDEQKITRREITKESLIDENNFYMPFTNTDKKTIADLYKENNLIESLFTLTFSCINSLDEHHCNNCWWCEERKWAFGKL